MRLIDLGWVKQSDDDPFLGMKMDRPNIEMCVIFLDHFGFKPLPERTFPFLTVLGGLIPVGLMDLPIRTCQVLTFGLQIEPAQPLRLQREAKAVPVAGGWIKFDAHECQRMIGTVEKPREILGTELFSHIGVIPVPEQIPGRLPRSEPSHVTRNPHIREMDVLDAPFRQETSKILLTAIRSVHANGHMPNIDDCCNTCCFKRVENVIGAASGIAEGVKVGRFLLTECIPFPLLPRLHTDRISRELK